MSHLCYDSDFINAMYKKETVILFWRDNLENNV